MQTELQQLIEQVKGGDAAEFWNLVRKLREGAGAPVEQLIKWLKDPHEVLRRAAVAAAQGRTEPQLLEAIIPLGHDREVTVRQALADALKEVPSWPLERVVETLLYDDDSDVRLSAVEAARWRPGLEGALVARLAQDDSWRARQAIAWGLTNARPNNVLPALVARLGEDGDTDVQRACAAAIEKHLVAIGGYPNALARPQPALLQTAQQKLQALSGANYPRLTEWLYERVSREVDVEPLKQWGTVLTAEADAGRLPRAYHVDELCRTVRKTLLGEPPRAAVLLGESGCGKTAVVQELAYRLLQEPGGPWHILRIIPGEFLTGTTYIGEWETKLRKILDAIRYPKRIILYIPNLQELAGVGTTSKSDLNVATMIGPYIERGEVTILGESTPEAFRTGLGAMLPIRRLFHSVEMKATDLAETRAILKAVRDEAKASVPEPVLDRLVELADYYLTGAVQPGRSVGLLRRVLSDTASRDGPATERDILATLSGSTGIPVDFLDDAIPLERAKARGFFEARVMGQPEAVDAVVDLVTLVKAGLTDPYKPFGVMLFIGPTGVGKTELARSLAEYLFGDPGRMTRLDMSEYATYDAFERLIGRGIQPGTLTSAVRERPFSVVLLDEIEKAHWNIFDLCLQIFDAGRLTDHLGRTADFRRTIIILTSNIGSSQPRKMGGFDPNAPTAPVGLAVADRDAMLRELGRWFRPEFLNRLDRIVQFRQLTEETVGKIARREVARVLERSGITRRRLSVEVDPAVFPLILREGFSATFGARPLKRTVERLVLLPLAQTITGETLSPGSVLRLLARQGRVDVQVASADLVDGSDTILKALPRIMPATERAIDMLQHLALLRDQAGPWAARKSELAATSSRPGFWDDRAKAQEVYDEIWRIDGLFGVLNDLDEAIKEAAETARDADGSDRELSRVEERLDVLDSQVKHAEFLVRCREARELGDSLMTLTLISSHGAGLDAVALLAKMYAGLGQRRRIKVEALADQRGGDPPEDAITLQISGVGAYALLAGESGLHAVSRGKREGKDGKKRPVDRDVVRVEVLPAATVEDSFGRDVRSEVRPLQGVQGRLLARPKFEVHLLHLPSMITVRGWTEGGRAEEAMAKLRPLLCARVAAQANVTENDDRSAVVRRYSLGPAPLVRDVRTGKHTGRLESVLQGHLDIFLTPPGHQERK